MNVQIQLNSFYWVVRLTQNDLIASYLIVFLQNIRLFRESELNGWLRSVLTRRYETRLWGKYIKSKQTCSQTWMKTQSLACISLKLYKQSLPKSWSAVCTSLSGISYEYWSEHLDYKWRSLCVFNLSSKHSLGRILSTIVCERPVALSFVYIA